MSRRARAALRVKLQDAVREVLAETDAERARELAGVRRELTRTREELREALVGLEVRQRRDLYFAAQVRAAAESAAFVLAELPTALPFDHPHDTLRFALTQVAVPGLALELGVASGTTLAIIVGGLPTHSVHGFDVFTGLPEDWRTGFPQGSFAQPELPDVPGAELVVGLFAETLPPFLAAHDEPVALLHVDADLYSSTVTILEHVAPRLVPGSVVVFDEYFNYPGWQGGEHAAWTELVARTSLRFSYLGYTRADEQLVVRVEET